MPSNSANYYSTFYFGGKQATEPLAEYKFGDRDTIVGGSAKTNNEYGEYTIQGNKTKEDLPKFKKSNHCYIEGCSKTFTFGGRSHCRRCGNSVCSKHISPKSVSMALFGYQSDELFEKVCVKCYDEAMEKTIGSSGQLSAGRLLDYLAYFRDRTRYCRIKRGIHAVQTLQIKLRFEKTKINRTWKDVGGEEEDDAFDGVALNAHFSQKDVRERTPTRDSIPMPSRHSISRDPNSISEEEFHMTKGAQGANVESGDRIKKMDPGKQVQLDTPTDQVPNPEADIKRASIKTRRVSRKFKENPILPSQRSADVEVARSPAGNEDTVTNRNSESSAAVVIPWGAVSDEDSHVAPEPPGRLHGFSMEESNMQSAYSSGTSDADDATADLVIARDEPISKNAAVLEAEEIMRKQGRSDKAKALSLKKPPGKFTEGGIGSINSSYKVPINNTHIDQKHDYSSYPEDEIMAMSPNALVSLSCSPAGMSALKEYMVNRGVIDIMVTSPNSRQYKTDEELASERGDIEKLIDLKKEASERIQQQRYLKGLEQQAQLDAEKRRQTLKEARERRLLEEEAVLSGLSEPSDAFEPPQSQHYDNTISKKPSQQTHSSNSGTKPQVDHADIPTSPNISVTESDDFAGVTSLSPSSVGETTSSTIVDGHTNDEEEAKEIARLEAAEKKRMEAIATLPCLPRLSAQGEVLGINSSTHNLTEAEYQSASGIRKRGSNATAAGGENLSEDGLTDASSAPRNFESVSTSADGITGRD